MMMRYCLLILCLLTSWSLMQAQESPPEVKPTAASPVTEAQPVEPDVTVRPRRSQLADDETPARPAVPPANRLTTFSPVLPLTVTFDEPDAKPVVVSGTYLDQEGLVMTVLPSEKPVKSIVPHFDRPERLDAKTRPEVTILARDALTGICLLKTPFRCLRPFSLSEKAELAKGTKLGLAVRCEVPNQFQLPQYSVVVLQGDVKSTQGNLAQVPRLYELYAWSPGNVDFSAPPSPKAFLLSAAPFRSWATPGTVFLGEQQTIAAVVIDQRKPQPGVDGEPHLFSTPCLALTSRDVLEICNRLLSEAKRPPLPKQQPVAPPAITQSLSAESVVLKIEYDNGDQDSAIGVFVSDDEIVVPTEVVMRSRLITTRQFELDRPFTLIGADPVTGLSVLKRNVWPQPTPRAYMNVNRTPFDFGQELWTIPPSSSNAASGVKVKIGWVGLAVRGEVCERSDVIGIDHNLEIGTPLFNAEGRFVAVVISDRHAKQGEGLAMSADDVWLGLARFRQPQQSEPLSRDEMQLRLAGKAVRRLIKLHTSVFAIYNKRLPTLFPELQFSSNEDTGSLIVELDAKQNEATLGWMEQIRGQLDLTLQRERMVAARKINPVDGAAQPETPTTAEFEQAVEQAKWITNKQILNLELRHEGIDEPFQQSGFFISSDGLLLTVITKKEPVNHIAAIFSGKENVELKVLARDPATGLALVSTPLRCQHPLNLADKWSLKPREALASLQSEVSNSTNHSNRLSFMVISIARESEAVADDVALKSPLTGEISSQPMEGMLRPMASVPTVTLKGQPLMRGASVAAMFWSYIKDGRLLAIAGDEARTICQRLLQEANRPPLPEPVIAAEPATDDAASVGTGDGTVRLQIEYNNGDRQSINAAVLGANGLVVTDGSELECAQKIRGRELGLSLDAQRSNSQPGDTLGVLKLGTLGKHRILDINLETPALAIGDSLFYQSVGAFTQTAIPCAKLVDLNATLSLFDISQTNLLRCDQSLEAGTPVFDRTGHFVGLCLATPKVFANTTFVMPADQMWKQIAASLNQTGILNQYNNNPDRNSPQFVQTYEFENQAGPIISPEQQERIYLRLKSVFPELQIALEKGNQSLIVVFERNQLPQQLIALDYWVQRLMKSVNVATKVESQPSPADPQQGGPEERKPAKEPNHPAGLVPLEGDSEQLVVELLGRYRTASAAQRIVLRKELHELTIFQFALREQQRLIELKKLEDRLASLRTELQKRRELMDEIVRKRVADLLGDENLLKWETEGESSPQKPTVP